MNEVSPEFVLRPLLSDHRGRRLAYHRRRVSPEFVLRPLLSAGGQLDELGSLYQVSPEFVLRPLLSVLSSWWLAACTRRVSPEFVLRPLLSEYAILRLTSRQACVAGVCAPAFVERGRKSIPFWT